MLGNGWAKAGKNPESLATESYSGALCFTVSLGNINKTYPVILENHGIHSREGQTIKHVFSDTAGSACINIFRDLEKSIKE